jgi:hypothetical protein
MENQYELIWTDYGRSYCSQNNKRKRNIIKRECVTLDLLPHNLDKNGIFLLLNSIRIVSATWNLPRCILRFGHAGHRNAKCLRPSAYLLVCDLGFVLTPTCQIKKTRQQLEGGKVCNINTMKSLPRQLLSILRGFEPCHIEFFFS